MDRRHLALEAAFTSMSLRERWREPGVVDTLELTSLPGTTEIRRKQSIDAAYFDDHMPPSKLVT